MDFLDFERELSKIAFDDIPMDDLAYDRLFSEDYTKIPIMAQKAGNVKKVLGCQFSDIVKILDYTDDRYAEEAGVPDRMNFPKAHRTEYAIAIYKLAWYLSKHM